eukprot:10636270-Heterocapsa_arctica.AAC.1
MMTNPIFRAAYEIRCLEWFGGPPTDAHLVPDNPIPNTARMGSYLQAKATFGVQSVPLEGLTGSARGS